MEGLKKGQERTPNKAQPARRVTLRPARVDETAQIWERRRALAGKPAIRTLVTTSGLSFQKISTILRGLVPDSAPEAQKLREVLEAQAGNIAGEEELLPYSGE